MSTAIGAAASSLLLAECLSADGVVRDSGLPDVVAPSASQHPVEDLPAETLIFLLGSRYCETQRLSDVARNLFEKSPPGWARVQAICDFVHRHIGRCHVVESLMRVRRVSQLKSCGGDDFAPRLHGRRPEGSVRFLADVRWRWTLKVL